MRHMMPLGIQLPGEAGRQHGCNETWTQTAESPPHLPAGTRRPQSTDGAGPLPVAFLFPSGCHRQWSSAAPMPHPPLRIIECGRSSREYSYLKLGCLCPLTAWHSDIQQMGTFKFGGIYIKQISLFNFNTFLFYLQHISNIQKVTHLCPLSKFSICQYFAVLDPNDIS